MSALEIEYTLHPIKEGRDHTQDPLMLSSGTELKRGAKYLERERVHAIYENRKKLLALEEREITL